MNSSPHVAGAAFDVLAATYDLDFTCSPIGRAQRDAVWKQATPVFRGHNRLLELNCGTGEDALFFAAQGHAVTAIDASAKMIRYAQGRLKQEAAGVGVTFVHLAIESLHELPEEFDAVFSNFSGMNCVADIDGVAKTLAWKTVPGAPVLLCVSTRVCAFEALWYLLQGKPRKATRRWSGRSDARIGGTQIEVFYPTMRVLRRSFAPWFDWRGACGVGLAVPPSYAAPVVDKFPRWLQCARKVDDRIRRWPVLRGMGDHTLLHFVRRGDS